MARKKGITKKRKIDLTTVEGLRAYAEQEGLGEQAKAITETKPKLSFLQRLGAGLSSLNPAEAILTGKEKGVLSGIGKYVTGIGTGIASAITGTDYQAERRYFRDVAEAYGIKNGIAKTGVGFLGDVLLDPSTYFGGAIAKALGFTAKTTAGLGLKTIEKVAPEAGGALRIAGEGVKDALGGLFKAGYKTQEGVVGNIISFLGRKGEAVKGLAESNLARLGTGVLTKEQNAEIFARLAGGKRMEFLLREAGSSAEDAGRIASQKVLEGATGKVKTTLEQQMERTAKFGQELAGDEFYRSYFPFIRKDKVSKFINDTRGIQVGSKGYLKQFKNLLTDENLEQDVASAFFNREAQVVTDKMTESYLKKFITDYGKPMTSFKSSEEARRAGYELLRTKGTWGAEVGYLPKWDYKFIQDMFSPEFKSLDILAKATGFDAVTSLFKRSVTGLFAPFHIRNFVSGVLQNYEVLGVGALNPKNIVSGQKLAMAAVGKLKLKEGDKMLDLMKPFQNRFAFSSFYKNEFDNALNAGQTLSEYEKAFSKRSLKKTLTTAGMSAESTPFKIARSVGNYIELQQKGVAYITALEQGKTIKQALDIAEKAGFDYRVLTKFESQILRRIVPFYSFTRKNIELQLRTLGENPQRINQIIRSISNLGDTPTEEEESGLPDYIKEGFAIKLPDTPEGLKQYLSSFGTPIEQFAGLFKENNFLNLLSQTNPILKVPIELGIGKDSFRQKDLKDVYDAKEYKKAPQVLKDLLLLKEVEKPKYKKVGDKLIRDGSYTQYVADPERLLIARSLFTSRGVTYLDQVFSDDLKGFTKFLKLFTGLKPAQFDIELGKALKEKDQRRALEDLLLKYSDVKQFQTLYKPK